MDKRMSIEEYIKRIKIRPGMFGVSKVEHIYFLIAGRRMGYYEMNKLYDIDENFFTTFHHWLFAWLKEKYREDLKFDFLWYQMINDVLQNDDEAFEMFYNACKDFLKNITIKMAMMIY